MSRSRRPRRRRWSLQEKADIVQRFGESGSSQKSFADSVGIHPNLLATWIRLARRGELPGPTPVLVPVRVRPIEPRTEAVALEVVLESQRVIRVTTGFDDATLARLVEVLERC